MVKTASCNVAHKGLFFNNSTNKSWKPYPNHKVGELFIGTAIYATLEV